MLIASYACQFIIPNEAMGFSNVYYLQLVIVSSLFLLFTFFPEAVHGSKKCYIVYMGAHSHGSSPTSFEMEAATSSHYDLLTSAVGSYEKAKEGMIYSYNKHINGFAAMLEEKEAAMLSKKANVVSVFLSKEHRLHTTRSWEFLGLQRNGRSTAWQKGRFGENTIIANIDTGVWPESRSFNDRGYGPVPSKWRGGNVCQLDKIPGYDSGSPCNRKLIGARYFSSAFEASNGNFSSPKLRTARDFEGHGTHTLSTAGGNFVPGAHVFAVGNGTAKGGSPRARVAAYKVCWSPTQPASCHEADVLTAIDQAISDGVDIISLSAGGRPTVTAQDIFTDAVSIGSFHAVANNILFVASAGNDGPTPASVVNGAPWIFTVGASTIDRDFSSTITFGNGQQITGGSLSVTLPPNQAFPLIQASDAKFANASIQDAELCRRGTLDPAKVKGKIVNCIREGKIRSVTEGLEAYLAGATAMLLQNQQIHGNTITDEAQMLSTVDTAGKHNDDEPSAPDQDPIYDDITASAPARRSFMTASLSPAKTVIGRKRAPVMASYSSRGPNKIQPSILKPDIIAPGVNILAAYSKFASLSGLLEDPRRGLFDFNVLQGTSMSCPHVSGIAGLIKTLHPTWSPAAIKSAIMTTASTRDDTNKPIQDAFDFDLAGPFDYGSGHVQPTLAIDPGLVYDLHLNDYLNFLCASGYNQQGISALNFNRTFVCKGTHSINDLNYPSITLPNLRLDPVTVTRTLTNVGPPGTYNVTARLNGCKITVVPNSLTFTKLYEKKTFRVTIQASSVIERYKYQFGELLWTDGKHKVRSPVVVQRRK
ncbi:subtilisin-like protease Glyma18g48580 [Arachis duranensis]|uniref:Subtilisin-like protease Glyma18g48580 n=1 Tax=Arachis duranensis TaxID=130453 RepID=A0A9C6WUN3_ARADU|nr:subtilisin-like protease Glyma18g48580 [Arachis duranensis]